MGWGGRLVSQTCSVNPSSSLIVAERAQRVAGPENTVKSEMRDVSCREIYTLLFITITTSATSATSAACDHYRGGGDRTPGPCMLGKHATVKPLPQPRSAFEDWGCLPGCQQPGFLQESKAVSLPTRHQHADWFMPPTFFPSWASLLFPHQGSPSLILRFFLSVCPLQPTVPTLGGEESVPPLCSDPCQGPPLLLQLPMAALHQEEPGAWAWGWKVEEERAKAQEGREANSLELDQVSGLETPNHLAVVRDSSFR